MNSRLDAIQDWEPSAKDVLWRQDLLAQSVGVSQRNFRRFVRDRFGKGLHEWLNDLRMRHAVFLLKEGKPIEIIAIELGFHSASAFDAAFHQWAGQCPLKFLRTKADIPHTTEGGGDSVNA